MWSLLGHVHHGATLAWSQLVSKQPQGGSDAKILLCCKWLEMVWLPYLQPWPGAQQDSECATSAVSKSINWTLLYQCLLYKWKSGRGGIEGLLGQVLGWPKSLLDFSIRCYGKAKKNFLANPNTSKSPLGSCNPFWIFYRCPRSHLDP